VPAGRVELDHLDALLDFVPHRLAELVGAVADARDAVHLHLPEVRMAIDRVAGRHDIASAR
jgi:hypothetical protein